MNVKTWIASILLLELALYAPAAHAAPDGPTSALKTVANLKAAYQGETTAHTKYAVYARVADKEGYKEVAQLFRAASQAESIHARNHKQALATLGVTNPKAGTYAKTPGTTRENLTDAFKGETYERDTMYPAMIREAQQEGQAEAERSMVYAISAEKQHAALYQAALKTLNQKPAGSGFYVCPVCGATYTPRDVPAASPVCGTPKAQFKRVR